MSSASCSFSNAGSSDALLMARRAPVVDASDALRMAGRGCKETMVRDQTGVPISQRVCSAMRERGSSGTSAKATSAEAKARARLEASTSRI